MPADIHAILLADLLPKLFRGGVEVKNMRLLSVIVGLKSVGLSRRQYCTMTRVLHQDRKLYGLRNAQNSQKFSSCLSNLNFQPPTRNI